MTLNTCVSQEMNNQTSENIESINNHGSVLISNDTELLKASVSDTHISVESSTNFDVVGDYFKIRLSDVNNNSVGNVPIKFSINSDSYTIKTDSDGIASLKLNLHDGDYSIYSQFLGNSIYASSSLTTVVHMNNTKIVASGLNNNEIQQIIDNAKPKNIILFEGKTYENINLVINKRLTLISYSNTVLNSNSNSPVFAINGKSSSSTKISGFKISSKGNGISIKDSDYVTVAKNTISTSSSAIVANNVVYLNITNNNIINNANNGIELSQSTNSYILNNKISNNKNGIVLSKSKNTYIYSNTISNNDENGIYTTNKISGVNYGLGPENLFVGKKIESLGSKVKGQAANPEN